MLPLRPIKHRKGEEPHPPPDMLCGETSYFDRTKYPGLMSLWAKPESEDVSADSAQGWVLPEGWTPEYQREIEEVAASYYEGRRQAVEALCLLYRSQLGTDAVTDYMLVEQVGGDGTVRWWLQRKDQEIQAPTLGKEGR